MLDIYVFTFKVFVYCIDRKLNVGQAMCVTTALLPLCALEFTAIHLVHS